jgi:predicted transcriptional regulator
MSNHTPISDQIRFAVRKSGMSQRDFAAAAGVPLSLLARFLAGGSVTSHNLDRILSALPQNLRKTLQP